MLKRLFVTTAIALQGASLCLAQVPPPSVPASNPHQTYDQKVRACKILATNQGLTGDARSAFIAQCVLA
jgi:hypothetical protein